MSFQRPTADDPELIFTQNTSNDTVPRKDAFSELENKKLIFKPLIAKKRHFMPDFDGTIFSRKQLYNGD